MARRWDTDRRLHGIGDGRALAAGIEALLRATEIEDWVAEEPELHLLPHLRRVVEAEASRWRLEAERLEGTVYVVDLTWRGDHARTLRGDLFGLVGAVAEKSTSIVEGRASDGLLTFDVVTGMVRPGDFAPHGHLLRLRVGVEPGDLPG